MLPVPRVPPGFPVPSTHLPSLSTLRVGIAGVAVDDTDGDAAGNTDGDGDGVRVGVLVGPGWGERGVSGSSGASGVSGLAVGAAVGFGVGVGVGVGSITVAPIAKFDFPELITFFIQAAALS